MAGNVKRENIGIPPSRAPLLTVTAVVLKLAVSTQDAWAKTEPSHAALPKGLLVFVGTPKGLSQTSEYSRAIVSVTTPALVRKTLRKPGAGFVTLNSVSPDGKKIAFDWNSPDTIFFGTPADLRILDTSKGTETTVLRGPRRNTLWSPDGSILCMDVPVGADGQVFLDLEHNRMWKWKPRLPAVSTSSRGTVLSLTNALFTARGIISDAYLGKALERSLVLFHWSEPAQVIGPALDGVRLASYSPDRSRIADLERKGTLTVRRSDGGDINWFNLRMELSNYPEWSPDGEWVAFNASSKKDTKFLAVNVNTRQTVNIGGMVPIWSGVKWVSLEPLPPVTVLASIEAALGPGEPVKFPMDCQREVEPDEDWSKYQPIGTCPFALQPAAKKKHE